MLPATSDASHPAAAHPAEHRATVRAARPLARTTKDFTDSLGMVLFLASLTMMFGALLFAYGFLRTRSVAWPPVGLPALPVATPAASTAVLLGASAAFATAVRAIGAGRAAALVRWLGVAFALGAAFIGLQLVVWRQLRGAGLYASSGPYGSVFYGLTALHALHIGFGLVALVWVVARASLGKYSENDFVGVRNCAMYWHFMGAVWVLMFVSIYLL